MSIPAFPSPVALLFESSGSTAFHARINQAGSEVKAKAASAGTTQPRVVRWGMNRGRESLAERPNLTFRLRTGEGRTGGGPKIGRRTVEGGKKKRFPKESHLSVIPVQTEIQNPMGLTSSRIPSPRRHPRTMKKRLHGSRKATSCGWRRWQFAGTRAPSSPHFSMNPVLTTVYRPASSAG